MSPQSHLLNVTPISPAELHPDLQPRHRVREGARGEPAAARLRAAVPRARPRTAPVELEGNNRIVNRIIELSIE